MRIGRGAQKARGPDDPGLALVGRWVLPVLACVLLGGLLNATAGATPATAPDVKVAQQALARLVVPFLASSELDDPRVAFRAHSPAGTLFVTRNGQLVYSLHGGDGNPQLRGAASSGARGDGWVLTETLVDARVRPSGAVASATRVSRFIGNDAARWQRDVPAFDTVSLGEPWPGIRVELAARGTEVEKLFHVAPGADVRRIAVRLRGARRVELAADGRLVAHTGRGPVAFTAPVAWQDIDGARRPVRVAYKLAGQRYGFALGDHDRGHAVVIDPLLQASYLGGSGGDIGYAIAVDASGHVYVAGDTGSVNFPGTTGGARASAGGGGDAFVAKLNRDLTVLAQATYIGGSASDGAWGLALDASGAVFVAGSTNSVNFPGTAGGAQPTPGGGGDSFVARLDGDLTQLTQATYLGGSAFDQAWALLVSAGGDVFVAGTSASVNFPATAGGAQATRAGAADAFVARLNRELTTLRQATYLGGNNNDVAYAIAEDALGAVVVAGDTGSVNFPGTAGAAQALPGGGGDAFVAKLDRNLQALTRATYLGGTSVDLAYAVAIDGDGAVFVGGLTASPNFPVTAGAAQPVWGGGSDAFIAKFDADLARRLGATFLGGSGNDVANALALAGDGTVYIAGNTLSGAFPGTVGGAQADPGGNGDGFVARLDGSLAALRQATFFGGSGLDHAFAIAFNGRGRLYVAGGTASFNLPGTAGGAQAIAGGGGDGFVAALTVSLLAVDSPAIEYRHTEWDHYFITADSGEIAKLDAGVFIGWARTGQSFAVLPLDTAGAANVCRFFSVSFAPKSSHFYTPSAAECAKVKQNPDWQFEGEVFAWWLPDGEGNCGFRRLPLYRLYNDGQGGAPNHRYTTRLATRTEMIAQGWIPEGVGPLGVVACVPA